MKPHANCGFRVIIVALGKKQNERAWVRRKMLAKMDNNILYWRPNLNREMLRYYDPTRHSLVWFDTVGPAPVNSWLSFPNMDSQLLKHSIVLFILYAYLASDLFSL
jgi:hypothetical protein